MAFNKKIILIIAVCGVVGALGILLSGGETVHTPAGERFEAGLKPRVEKRETSINLRELTDFEWQEVCFSAPYGAGEFSGNPNLQLDDAPWYGGDAFWGLVFLGKEDKATLVSVSSGLVQFSDVPYPDKCLCGNVQLNLTVLRDTSMRMISPTGEACASQNTLSLLQGRLEKITESRAHLSNSGAARMEIYQKRLNEEERRILERIKKIKN